MAAVRPLADRPPPRQPFLPVAVAGALGIVIDRYGSVPLGLTPLHWWLASTTLLVLATVLRCQRRHRCFALALWISFACLGGGWHQVRWNYVARNHLARYATRQSQPVCVEVEIEGPVRQWQPAPDPLRNLPTEPRSEVLVSAQRLRDGRRWLPVSGSCRLRVVGPLRHVQPGDRVRVFARCRRPQPAANPGQYDWAQAERGAGRYCELFCQTPECLTVLPAASPATRPRYSRAVAAADAIRQRCQWRLKHYVGGELQDLALALILGERAPPATTAAFRQTGTAHLLVVSGLHVGMLALAMGWVIRTGLIPRRWGLVATACLVVAYAGLAGGRPPVVRASVLIVLCLWALGQGRNIMSTNLLCVAAGVVLVINPSELFRGGTQLSFLCVAALIGYGTVVSSQPPPDPLTRLLREASPWYWRVLRGWGQGAMQLALASLVIWIVAAPLVAYHFHLVTPVGIALTPLLWPLVAGALLSGLGLCACGWAVPPLAVLMGNFCAGCLAATASIITLANQTHLINTACPGPPLVWLLVFYAGLAGLNLIPRWRLPWRWQLVLASLWVACGLAAAAGRHNPDQLRCTFLAVGHGTCVVLELPGDQTVLYDAGSLGSSRTASRKVAGYLWSRGITQIEAIFISHADVDHYAAVPGLLELFSVGAVYVAPQMFSAVAPDAEPTAVNYLRTALAKAQVPVQEIWQHHRLQAVHDGVTLEVLHPPCTGVGGSDNANSIVLSIRFAGQHILLPGDLESPGLEACMRGGPLDVDILLAPHHGSHCSDPAGFSAWCTPDWTIISGQHATESVTAATYQAQGSKTLSTSECGAIHFIFSQQSTRAVTTWP